MKSVKIIGTIFPLMAIALFSCLEESEFEKNQKANDKAIYDYLSQNNIDATKSEDGFYFEKLVENTAGTEPIVGDVMLVKYVMKTLEGVLVESKTEEITLFRYELNGVIPIGVAYGINEMKTGEKIRIYLPAHMAYDSYGNSDDFNSFTNFIFDLELIGTKTEAQIKAIQIDSIDYYIEQQMIVDIDSLSEGLYFKSILATTGTKPARFSQVKIIFTRKNLDGTITKTISANTPLTVNLNDGQLVAGLNEGIMKMSEGDSALMIMTSDFAFGASVQIMPSTIREELFDNQLINTNVTPYTPVLYEVKLLDVN